MQNKYKISHDIYDVSYVLQAISAFEDVSNVQLIEDELIMEWETQEEIDELFNEFMNYVIYLINE